MKNKCTNLASKVAITGLVLSMFLFVLAGFIGSNKLHNTIRLAHGLEPESIIEQLF